VGFWIAYWPILRVISWGGSLNWIVFPFPNFISILDCEDSVDFTLNGLNPHRSMTITNGFWRMWPPIIFHSNYGEMAVMEQFEWTKIGGQTDSFFQWYKIWAETSPRRNYLSISDNVTFWM
jgi:hypothetical protein